jgi:hypothetical protein
MTSYAQQWISHNLIVEIFVRTRYNQTCIRLHNMYAERRGPTPRSAQKLNESKGGMMMKKAIGMMLALCMMFTVAVYAPAPKSAEAATSYYVATTGLDTNAGTLASPFKTVQKCASVAQAGDTCFIRGGTYRETVTPGNSGTSAAPVTFTAYADEEVTISGADIVSGGWSVHSGSTYKTSAMNWDLGLGLNQIFVDGVMMNDARWPNMPTNATPSYPVLARVDSGSATGSGSSAVGTVNDNALGSGHVGAKINIAPSHGWVMQTGTVTSSSSGTLKFSYNQWSSYFVPNTGHPYFLWGKLSLLDAAKETFYDSATDILYLRTSGGDSPASHTVEAKKRQFAFDLSGRSYVVIEGLKVFAASIKTSSTSQYNVFDNITAEYISHDINIQDNPWIAGLSDTGIQLYGSNHTVQYSTISYSSGNGLVLRGNDHTVMESVIHDMNYAATDAAAIHTGMGGVTPLTTGHQILNNSLYDAGRSVIVHRNAQDIKIKYNEVYNAGIQVEDLGMIYTYGTDGGNSEIAYNLVHDGLTTNHDVGIYLDNNSSNYIVHHNVVWNTDLALQLNASSTGNLIYNNTLMGNEDSIYNHFSGDFTGTQIINNILRNDIGGIPSSVLQQTNLYKTTDPLFTNASAHDYTLQSSSPAINSGTALSPYTDGYSGSAPDIGAYEYGVTPWVAGPTGGGGGGIPNHDALTVLQAEDYDDMSGVANYGSNVGSFDDGNWIKFDNVEFSSDITTFKLNAGVSAAYAGQQFEVRLDSVSGPLAGTVTMRDTGGFGSFEIHSIPVTGISAGIHDLYIVGNGTSGIGNIDWLTFDLPTKVEAESYDAMSGIANYGSNIGSFDDGDWFAFTDLDLGDGYSGVTLNIGVSSTYAGQQVEVRLGSATGTLIGTLTVQATAGFGSFEEQSIPITQTSGVQDIYFVGAGTAGIGNVDWISFQ